MYSHFSAFYDKIMAEVDYQRWAGYITDIVERSGTPVESVLELACGTGSVLLELERINRFPFAVGLDKCADMVKLSAAKARKSRVKAHFIAAEVQNFTLKRRFDLILCLFYSFNYLVTDRDLHRTLMNVYCSLADRKLFIFDVILRRKIETFFPNGTHAEDLGDLAYIWQCQCLQMDRIYEIRADFFKRTRGNSFRKYTETHVKRVFGLDELKALLDEMDFTVTGIYDALSFREPDQYSQRVFFICRKGG
ncbi:MAG: class I SAM-dependent methyltransferase [Candidatus Wallbacteria bacterium]|nr:class I SAM-dependent methyltransferase [Candidatus Wallbacteria bacterium]